MCSSRLARHVLIVFASLAVGVRPFGNAPSASLISFNVSPRVCATLMMEMRDETVAGCRAADGLDQAALFIEA